MKKNNPYENHSRQYLQNTYVYPVISRRSGGISIGINLNTDKRCNYDCVYCQVDRIKMPPPQVTIDTAKLKLELETILSDYKTKKIFQDKKFANLKDNELPVLKDIAFSGDGEPTLCPQFSEVVDLVFSIKDTFLNDHQTPVKIIVISNGTNLWGKSCHKALLRLLQNNGDIWVKVDATTKNEFQNVYDVKLNFEKFFDEIFRFGLIQPVTIQTMTYIDKSNRLSLDIDNYIKHFKKWLKNGFKIKEILLYTLARDTRVDGLKKLSTVQLENFQSKLENELKCSVKIFS